jgi:FAD-dependent monooxygenase
VEATLVDDTGDVLKIRASYLVGCDGASSRVRNELGIAMEGAKDFTTFALVHFRSADMANLHALGQFWHIYTTGGAVMIAQDEVDTWTLHQDLGSDVDDPDPIGDPTEFVARALGAQSESTRSRPRAFGGQAHCSRIDMAGTESCSPVIRPTR